jgi:hypothetical protein
MLHSVDLRSGEFVLRLFITSALILLAGLDSARASTLCPNPRENTAALSFSIPSFSPGGMDNICASAVENGVALGFTSVTITPKIAFDRNTNAIDTVAAVSPGEVTRCLEIAWEAGLDIIYSPHVEDSTPDENAIWRAKMSILPDATYTTVGFGEFLSWLQARASDISTGNQTIRVTIETELENSTTGHPNDWKDFTQQMRSSIAALDPSGGLTKQVSLGIQPNWYPISDPSFLDCGDYRDWIASLDWIAPSMYGDWSQVQLGADQPQSRIDEVLGRLTREDHLLCQVPEFKEKPYSFGELGIGSDLVHAERWNPVSPEGQAAFVSARETVYSNLFSWMTTKAPNSGYSRVINIWALGIYDPVGISVSPATIPDPVIAKEVGDYKEWRCN